MVMNYEQAQYLINMKKKILENGVVKDSIVIEQHLPMRLRFESISEIDNEYTFLIAITQSPKGMIRINLHCQDQDSKIGLVRVDYNSGHFNPINAPQNLPDIFKPYIGKQFGENGHHVHYYIDGYRSLAWAIPIGDTDIRTKDIRKEHINEDLANAIVDFARFINVETEIIINKALL